MDIGTGITAAGGIFGIVAIIYRIFPRNEKSGIVVHCDEHSGVCTSLESLSDWLTKIEGKLDRVIERRSN